MLTPMQPIRAPVILCDLQYFTQEIQPLAHTAQEVLALVHHLLQDMFLVTVVGYDDRLGRPHRFINELRDHCPHYESLFRDVTQPLRMVDVPDVVDVYFEHTALLRIDNCAAPTYFPHSLRTLHDIDQHTA